MTTPTPIASAPIPVSVRTAGYLSTDPGARFTEPHPPLPPALRATPLVVLTAANIPFVVRGIPTLPTHGIHLPLTVTATQGPDDIHPVPDTDPVWDPDTGTWVNNPGPSGVGDIRWTVQTLPDPSGYVDGTYPLGARSTADETDEIESGATAWFPDPGTGGPAWNSAVPFKPEVSARNVAGAGGQQINHPKGVAFAANGAHMWLDMGADTPQPFTWVVVAVPFSAADRARTVLDSGRNPYDVGFGTYTEGQLADQRPVADNLPYRTALQMAGPAFTGMFTNAAGYLTSYLGKDRFAVMPRMYGAVFNGSASMLWVRGPDTRQLVHGTVNTGTPYTHRYYVLGRQYGAVGGTATAQQMFVMEVRFWHSALTESDMEDQYAQLSSTYQFGQYP